MKRWMLAAILGVGLLAAALLAGPPGAGASWAPLEKTPVEEDGDPDQPGVMSQSPSAEENSESEAENSNSRYVFEAILTACVEVLGL